MCVLGEKYQLSSSLRLLRLFFQNVQAQSKHLALSSSKFLSAFNSLTIPFDNNPGPFDAGPCTNLLCNKATLF